MTFLERIRKVFGRATALSDPEPKDEMHWQPPGWTAPFCGDYAGLRYRWTVELEAATCPVCRRDGEAFEVQSWINER